MTFSWATVERAALLRAVIVSVRYDDMIARTAPAWKQVLPAGTLAVVTSPDDHATQAVCAAVGVPAIVTDAFTRIDETCHADPKMQPPTFNCALAMDEALGLAGDLQPCPSVGELIVNINADCYPVGRFPSIDDLKAGMLYGFWRHHCLTPKDFGKFQAGTLKIHDFRRMKNSGGRPVGYFQMWRYRAGERFRSYPNAGKYDTHFCDRWAPHMVMRDELAMLHLGEQKDWDNWRGRVVPRWEAVAS